MMSNAPYSNAVSFYVAEVTAVTPNPTYNLSIDKTLKQKNQPTDRNVKNIYMINCSVIQTGTWSPPIIAKPADLNTSKIPLVGEHVLVFRGYRADSNVDSRKTEWFYLNTLSISSDINLNAIPGVADSRISGSAAPGDSFKERVISILQQFEGDVVFQGRWGNSIRFGSTIDTKNIKVEQQPTWRGDVVGDPITIISNNRKVEEDSFVVEHVQDDSAAIYLTSTQQIPTLTLGTSQQKNPLRCFTPTESQYAKSQLIGTADRIVLKAKTDVAVIDAPKAIILNTTGDVKIGSDEANISMVHGDVLLVILQKILNQLNVPIQAAHLTGTFLDKSNIQSAQRDLQKLLSSKYFIKRQTY
jgi:hypothetical protein